MMSLTHVELYEALRPFVGDDAARMMAEVLPPAEDLVRKSDVADLRVDMHDGFSQLRAEMHEGFADVYQRLADMSATHAAGLIQLKDAQVSTLRWMVGLFIPVWAGTWATVVTLILKS